MKQPLHNGRLVALGITLAVIAWAFAAGAGETGGAARWIVMALWCLGGAIAGGGALMPLGLTRWGVVLGIVLQVALLIIVARSHL